METKFATGIAKGDDSLSVGREVAKRALEKIGRGSVTFSIVFIATKYDYASVVKGIREVTNNAPVIGISAAGEFTEENVDNESVACALISSDTMKIFTGMGTGLMENDAAAIAQAVKEFPKSVEGYPNLSAIILVDGLAGKGEESALGIVGALGTHVKIAGGSAADDYKFKETKVFYNDEVSSDAVVVALLASKVPVFIGVKHGHFPISPPLKVTKVDGNIVKELDGRPAVEVWMEYTREPAKKVGIDVDKMWDDPQQLGRFTCIYEGGVSVGKDEYKVRWTGLRADMRDVLPFACSIPEGTVMRIMESSKEKELISARQAAEEAVNSSQGVKLAGAIVFDCAVRGALLGPDFVQEVEEIKKVTRVPLVGCATYGEFAMETGQLSGFHNTTTVVMLIPA